MSEPSVDLGAISLTDARVARRVFQKAIDDGYFAEPESYAAVLVLKAMLQHRIAQAEKAVALPAPTVPVDSMQGASNTYKMVDPYEAAS